MQIVCSYCHGMLGLKAPFQDDRITHSICEPCREHFSRQWRGLSLGEYLDEFDAPVIVVNQDGRIVAANQTMAELLGKPQREIAGLLGGEAMECVYSRLPGGCGETTHCTTCTIRINVTATRETGEPRVRVPAYLDTDDGRTHFIISTYKKDDVVQVVIEDVVGRVECGVEAQRS